jgi:membrane protease YdiL (CAAX protease family)
MRRYLTTRQDPLTAAVLVFPLFMIYQVGILLGARGHNGVDFASRMLMELCQRDLSLYVKLLLVMTVCYGIVIALLRRSRTFEPRDFLPVLLESSCYALAMGSLILLVIRNFLDFVPGLVIRATSPGEVLVISAGAGFHEELFFRALLMAGLAKLLAIPLGRRRAWLTALAVSSLLFSLVHHLGPGAEPFGLMAFSYRALAGAYFGVIYQVRGFAAAAWTHTLYDVYVLSFA